MHCCLHSLPVNSCFVLRSLLFTALQQLFHAPPAAAFEPARLLLADRTMYAVHPIPLSEVKAIRKHAPSFGWQYIVLILVNGLTLPPLYFGTGGVRALFAALKQVHLPTGYKC